jgi:hypothetical protein
MKQSHVHSAIKSASIETTRLMSARLRSEARASGWPEHVVRSLHVSHGEDGFAAHVNERHHAETLDHEYGTPSTQPSPAIRRSTARTSEAESFLIGRLFKHIEREL